MGNLVTRLLLDTKGFDGNIENAKKYVEDFKKQGDEAKKGMEKLTESMDASLVRFAGVAGAAYIAKEGFAKFMAAGQTTSDWLDQQTTAWRGMIDGFFESLNNGNVSGFLANMGTVRDAFIDVAKARDALNDHKLVDSDYFAPQENLLREQLRGKITDAKHQGKTKEIKILQAALDKLDADVYKRSMQTSEQYNDTHVQTLKSVVGTKLISKGHRWGVEFDPEGAKSALDAFALSQKFTTVGGKYVGAGKEFYDELSNFESKLAEFDKKSDDNKPKRQLKMPGRPVKQPSQYVVDQQKLIGADYSNFIEESGKKLGKLVGVDFYDPRYASIFNELNDEGRKGVLENHKGYYDTQTRTQASINSTKRQRYAEAKKIGGKSEVVYSEGSLGWYDKEIQELTKKLNQSTDVTVSQGIVAQINQLRKKKEELEKAMKPSELSLIQERYNNESSRLKKVHDAGVMTDEEYHADQYRVAQSALSAAAGLDDVSEGCTLFKKEMKDTMEQTKATIKANDLSKIKYITGVITPRDSMFDYRLNKKERMVAEKENIKLNITNALETNKLDASVLKDLHKANGDYTELKLKLGDQSLELLKELDNLQKMEISIDAKIKIEEVREDVLRLNKEVQRGAINIFTTTTGAISSIYGNMKSVIDTLSDESANGFEKFLAVVEAIGGTVSSIVGVSDAIVAFIGIIEMLTGAKQALAIADGTAAAAAMVSAGATLLSEGSSAGTAATSAITVAAAKAETAAFTELAAAKIMAAHASIPFVGVPLGSAFVASAIAVIQSAGVSTAGAFADGGIIGGTSYSGDRIFAAVNSGEMVLNSNQQKNMFRIIDQGMGQAGHGGYPSEIKFKLRGKDIEGVLSNMKKMSR